MNYRVMILTVLLLPSVISASNTQTDEQRIRALVSLKLEKEAEVVKLGKRISKEAGRVVKRGHSALKYWKPLDGADKQASFDNFIYDLGQLFDKGEDTHAFLKQAPLDRNNKYDIDLMMLRLAIQETFIRRMLDQCAQSVRDLEVINQEIKNSRSSEVALQERVESAQNCSHSA